MVTEPGNEAKILGQFSTATFLWTRHPRYILHMATCNYLYSYIHVSTIVNTYIYVHACFGGVCVYVQNKSSNDTTALPKQRLCYNMHNVEHNSDVSDITGFYYIGVF